MLRILMGRARTGKSDYVLSEIARAGRDEPESRQILMVPEHASHVAEVDICRACGDGASRHAEVLTFKLLASRVLSITGGGSDVTLDGGGKLLTLQLTLQELAPILHFYARPSQRSAFLKSLLDVLEELSAYATDPKLLSEKVADIEGESGDKLRDIALIYGIYLSRLNADDRDARDRLDKLVENLEASGYIDGKDIYLDGYSYFTGRERSILRIMLRRARSVTVTLLGDQSNRELFCESLRVREELISDAKATGVTCETEYLRTGIINNELDHIEHHFFGERVQWTRTGGNVRIFRSTDAYTEAERTAAEILRLVREEGYRYRDISVTSRELTAYETVVETVFARYGIPLYSARRSDILQQPLTALVLGALDAATGGFEYEDMFRCLKTSLAGISSEECDILENYVLTWDIRGNMWINGTEWTAHPNGYGLKMDDESEKRLAKVNELRERLRKPFFDLHEGLKKEKARDKITALYSFLEKIKLPDTLEKLTKREFEEGDTQCAEETAQLWSILCDIMDQTVSILGDTSIDSEEFARMMRLVLSQYSVGTIPASLDRVSLSEMTRNDRHTVRAVFILGANDGALPAVGTGGGILSEEDRLALESRDVVLTPHGMATFNLEMQNLYAALAQPTQKLYISYPLFDASGAQLQPSFVIGRILALLPCVKVEDTDNDKQYRLTAKLPALEYAGEHIDGAAWRVLEKTGEFGQRMEIMRRAACYLRGSLSPEGVQAIYGKRLSLSASKIDKARSCHFAYFMEYGLRARERTSAQFDAPQMGTFVHDVLENTLSEAGRRGGIKTIGADELRKITRSKIKEYIDRELPDLEKKTARFRYLFRRLCESTYRIMDEVADELKESDFEPLYFELEFGPNGQLPSITFEERESSVQVVGKVDRVDGWLNDGKLYLRVVDYKTGKKSFDLAELRYGLGLQMLLYLFALEREGSGLFGAGEIVPAGVLYTPAKDEIISLSRNSDVQTIRSEMQKLLRRSGMVLNDDKVLVAMEHSALTEPQRLPISVKTDKKGNSTLSGNLATAEQLGHLSLYVEKLIKDIARETASGNIDADPFVRDANDNACRFCPSAAACHFEPGRGRDHYEYILKTGTAEFWSAVDSAIVGGEAKDNG
ncbi:MAG: PD-(D/E)XK nuclease family protein [Oscillospiraceae bacterium]|nr:PD-(D/E)XK nuclease family protein [Oscillospiraceae bacterium]